MLRSTIAKNPEKKSKETEKAKKYMTELNSMLSTLKGSSMGTNRIIAEYGDILKSTANDQNRIVELLEQNRDDEAIKLMNKHYKAACAD